MKGPTGEERTAPTAYARPRCQERSKLAFLARKPRLQRAAAPCGSLPAHGTAVPGPESRVSSPGPGRQGTGDRRAGPNELTMARKVARSFKAAGGRFAAGPWLGLSPGGGGGNASGGGCSTGSAQLSPAPPRACYINRRGTMSLTL